MGLGVGRGGEKTVTFGHKSFRFRDFVVDMLWICKNYDGVIFLTKGN